MTQDMDENFAYFYKDEGFGPAIETRPLSAETIDNFRGKLPDQWMSVTPSGVRVEGYLQPRTTVYPIYQGAPKE